MQALLRLEGVLEHMRGARHRSRDIAAAQVIIERDIGAATALEMFQIGESTRRPQHVMDQNVRLHGCDFVKHRRQLFILGRYQLRGLFGDMRITCQYGGDRLADKANFVEGKYRLIVKRRPVIGLRNERLYVFPGEDAIDARHGASCFGIDAANAPVRDGCARELAVQHAGQAQIMRVVGAPGDLGMNFEPRDVASDLIHGRTCCVSCANARRTARPTYTRNNSRL